MSQALFEWVNKHSATMYEASIEFCVSIEEAYRLYKDGYDDATGRTTAS